MNSVFNSIKLLTNKELIHNLKNLKKRENEILIEILHHMKEVERRMIYTEYGYSSMFEYATKELGYSESAAYRRISSMRLLKDLPEIEDKIKSGKITLSQATAIQSHFKNEAKYNKPVTRENKIELVQNLSGTSSRETEKILASLNPNNLRPDREKVITEDKIEIRFTAGNELSKKLDRIKKLIAHKNPAPTYDELLNLMSDIVLDKIDPEIKLKKKIKKSVKEKSLPTLKKLCNKNTNSRYIPQQIKDAVIKRDGWHCSYVDPKTNKKCNSTYGLQYEHKIPFAKGGKHSVDNLVILCREHNKFLALKSFGTDKMKMYIPRLL